MAASSYGLSTYGPVVDGLFAPGIPGKLLLQGSFDHSLKLMLGHNADEGLSFTSPFVSNDTAYRNFVKSSYPDISPDIASYIADELYPAPSNSTLYKDGIGRASLTISESTFTCNTLYLDRVCTASGSNCAVVLIYPSRLLGIRRTHINSVYLRLSTVKTSLTPFSMVRMPGEEAMQRYEAMRLRVLSKSTLRALLRRGCPEDQGSQAFHCTATTAQSSTSILLALQR